MTVARRASGPGSRDRVDIPLASAARAARPLGCFMAVAGRGHAGTLVLCEVVEVGACNALEMDDGRTLSLEKGVRFIGVLANRFSTTSICGSVPPEGVLLPSDRPWDVLASPGVIGKCISVPAAENPPTRVTLIGGLAPGSNGAALLLTRERAVSGEIELGGSCPVVIVCGTVSNVGKTTFARALVTYLTDARSWRVAAAKLAGTGGRGDIDQLSAAGAVAALSFADGGLPTTYSVREDVVVGVARWVLKRLGDVRPDVIVAECGGDIVGAGVSAILADPQIQAVTARLVVVPSDPIAAVGAASVLASRGVDAMPWFAMPPGNELTTRWRSRHLLGGDHFVSGRSHEDLERLLQGLEAPVWQ